MIIFTADDVEQLLCAPVVTLAVIGGKITQPGDHAPEHELMRFLFYRYMSAGAGLTILVSYLDQNGPLAIPIDLHLGTVQL